MAVRLVCWNEDLAKERAKILKEAGISVDASPLKPAGLIRNFRENPPEAVIIDLDRLPSHGREVAVALRTSKATRHLPLVLAGGAKEKVTPIRRELPDAEFTDWAGAARAVKRALKRAPQDPVLPVAHMERYAGSGLAKKLGIAARSVVALLNAPEDFEITIDDLPEDVSFESAVSPRANLVLWFVRSRRELEETQFLTARLPQGAGLWIAHPKQTGPTKTDFNQNDVRAAGLAAGLVDYKVCSVDASWSGLKFARRRDPLSMARNKR